MTFCSCCLLAVALAAPGALPPGAPVPAGAHPRLTVTREELAVAADRAQREPLVARAMRGLVDQAEAAYRGEPIELPPHDAGANLTLMGRAVSLGYGALLTGRDDWAREAGDILLAYAAVYPQRPAAPEGRVYRYSLQESMWLAEAAVAADLVFASDALDPAERQRVIDDLLRPAAAEVMTDRRIRNGRLSGHHACYNWQAWHTAGVGLVGYLLDDAELIGWAVDSEFGFRHLIGHDIRDDGLFWERSFGYQSFVINAVSRLMEAALRAGLDLWNLTVADDSTLDEWGSAHYTLDADNGPKTVTMMLAAARDYVFPDLSAAPVGDSGRTSLAALTSWLELALTRTGQRQVAEALDAVYRRTPPTPPGWTNWAPDGDPTFDTLVDDDGHCVLVITQASDGDRGCWVSPRVATSGHAQVTISLRYRTRDIANEKAVLLRVMPRAAGRNLGDQAITITLPPSPDWRAFEQTIVLPAETDSLGVDPFIWRAVGRLEFTALGIASADRTLLEPDAFREVSRRQPRGVLPWNLLPELPMVAPQADERFGTTGQRRHWSSLFPASGFAVLRQAWEGDDVTAAVLSYGPYGGGHGHPDMLKLVARVGGQTVLASLPFFDYDDRRHGTWTNTTVAHNTVVIDQTSQFPGGTGSGWGNVSPQRLVQGRLLGFHADEQVKVARASCDNAHLGAVLDRTVAILDGALVDWFQVATDGGGGHTFDYVLHLSAAPVVRDLTLAAREPLTVGQGYEHLTELRSATTDGPVAVDVGPATLVIAAAPGSEIITARVPTPSGTAPLLMVRRTGRGASFGTVVTAGGVPATVTSGPASLIATVAGRAWRLAAGKSAGVTIGSDLGDWQVGGEGEPTRRSGAAGAAEWPPLWTGGVFIPATVPE